MFSDDFPLRVQLIVGFTVPPILTAVCWLAGRRMAGASGRNSGDERQSRVLVDACCRLCDLRPGSCRQALPG